MCKEGGLRTNRSDLRRSESSLESDERLQFLSFGKYSRKGGRVTIRNGVDKFNSLVSEYLFSQNHVRGLKSETVIKMISIRKLDSNKLLNILPMWDYEIIDRLLLENKFMT